MSGHPFPDPSPPTVREVLAAQDFQTHGPIEAALRIVDSFSVHDGATILGLALAIGCLCREIAALKEGHHASSNGAGGLPEEAGL